MNRPTTAALPAVATGSPRSAAAPEILAGAALQPADRALVAVGRLLQQACYRFVTITPDSHALVVSRPDRAYARDLRGVFGWNLPFLRDLLPEPLFTAMQDADALERLADGRLRSRVRFSSVGERLFVHSAYPTTSHDAVFLGPDTYRFVHLLRRTLGGGGTLLEIGAGSGAAALCLADRFAELVLTDINPLAVRYARVNAELDGCAAIQVHATSLIEGIEGDFDAIIANPPYLIDASGRWYRDGGAQGIDVALHMVRAALPRLTAGGVFVLYTGTPVIDGTDQLARALVPLLAASGLPSFYDELDVDIFGGELAGEAYGTAERIALVALVVGQPGTAGIAHPPHAPHRRQDGTCP